MCGYSSYCTNYVCYTNNRGEKYYVKLLLDPSYHICGDDCGC